MIFFPLKFAQTEENLSHLKDIELEIRAAFSMLNNRHVTKYDKAVAKNKMHKKLRECMQVVDDAFIEKQNT